MSRRVPWSVGAVVMLAAVASIPPACGEKKGGLMLAITTDMKAPKDVSILSLTIKSGTQIKHNVLARVRPNGDVELPATIAIAEPDDPNATIRVRVVAFQERKPRVLRDVRTTIPRGGRTALLRLGLNFVNDGSGTGDIPVELMPGALTASDAEFDAYSSVVSKCDLDQTVIDGECKDDYVDPETLPDFEESLVFGSGGAEGCFRTAACFAGAARVEVAPGPSGGCSFPLGARPPEALNFALATRETGECLPDGRCLIPLDQGALGFRVNGANVELSPGTCNKLREGAELLEGRGGCAAKSEAQPLCVGAGAGPGPVPDGGVVKPGTAEKMMPENFPTGVAVLGADLYMLSAQGLAVLKPGAPGQNHPGVTPRPGPRFITRAGTGIAIAEGPPKPASAPRGGGFILPDPAGGANRIDFPDAVSSVNAVAFLGVPGAEYVWAATPPPGTSGLFSSAVSGAAAQADTEITSAFATSVAALPLGELLLAGDDGSIAACRAVSGLTCDPPRPTASNARIDALVPLPAVPQTALYLQADAVWRAGLGGATIAATKVVPNVAVAPLARDNFFYAHGLVVSGPCAFFTTNDSVQWVKVEGGPGAGVIAATGANVPLGIDVGAGPGGAPYVYWALFAGLNAEGGAYRAPVPAECVK